MDFSPYALVAQEKQYPLQVGKNVIGRCPAPLDGAAFINLESPQTAISRTQAFLDVGRNGDAWLCDCNSTNGTFLCIRPGPGIRLEPSMYYQLSPGCRIVFGNIQCVFQALGTTSDVMPTLQPRLWPVPPTTTPPRKMLPLAVLGASADMVPPMDASKTRGKKSARGNRGSIPYLEESGSERSESPSAAASGEAEPATKKNRNESAPKVAAKKPAVQKKDTGATPATAAPLVCLSGMDSDQRTAVGKRVRQLKGRVVDDIIRANLLVVATPPVRTPKFIIAVARCIPVVSVQFICDEHAHLRDARQHIVSLESDSHTYTSAALEKVIYRKNTTPTLSGVVVNTSGLSAKTKAMATAIITASGGEVVRTRKGEGLAVTDDSLDTLYDSILRGKVPISL